MPKDITPRVRQGAFMGTEIILTVLEILGTVAFAISGAYVAIKARLDVFGVVIIGCITCIGGGIIRDIIIGSTPPRIFDRLYFVLIAAVVSLIYFIIACIYRKKFEDINHRVEQVNNVFDAIGLGAFTVLGTEIAFIEGVQGNVGLSLLLGVLTGVGGGVFRDILTATTPYIFKKHVYAIASIVGAVLYYVIRYYTNDTLLPSIIAMAVVIVIRLLAAHFHWELPKANIDGEYQPIKFYKKGK